MDFNNVDNWRCERSFSSTGSDVHRHVDLATLCSVDLPYLVSWPHDSFYFAIYLQRAAIASRGYAKSDAQFILT